MQRLYPILALGFIWRICISWLTPIPSEDGVNYLWMAERLAEGEASLALSEVFPPLLSLLTAVPVALGLDPFRAAQLILSLGGTLAVLPLARATEVVVPCGGVCAGCVLAFSPLPIRFAAEVYTEPLFLLLGGLAINSGLRQCWWALGLWSGMAFWVRPEALILPLAFVVTHPRRAWRALLPAALLVMTLSLWRAALGLGFSLVAKLDLILERSVASEGSHLTSFFEHLIQIPWLSVEAYGLVVPLALWGLLRNRSRGMVPLYWAFLFAVIVICGFLPRRRFLVSWLIAVTPIAVAGLYALPRGARTPVIWAIVALGVTLSLRTTDPNRLAERRVGEYLAAHLPPGESVSGDMTRVIYYSGRRPLTPRRFTPEEIIEAALEPDVRYVVLGARRESTPAVTTGLETEFAPFPLPTGLDTSAADRGILVLRRR